MKKTNQIIQFLVGSLSILLLWCVGGFANMAYFNYDMPVYTPIASLVAVALIAVLLFVFTFVCKYKSFNAMYIGAVIATALPVLSYFLSSIFSDDGNILSWIFAFTLGIVLYPFSRLAHETFDGISSFYFCFVDERFIEPQSIAFKLTIAIIISVILYLIIKPKKLP